MTLDITSSRRSVLGLGGAMLSAAAVAVLVDTPAAMAAAHGGQATEGDVAILNVALGLEHEAIAAYSIGAGSGLLSPEVTSLAVVFQSHHKEHRDALAATITKMGGAPVAAMTDADYAKKLDVANTVKSATDVLKLAQRLEKGAANAYIGVIPSLGSHDLAKVAAQLAADEVTHWTLLTSALQDSYPPKAFIFG